MRRISAFALVTLLTISMTGSAFADFQYTETSTITGGAMAGTMKMLGAFSKDARKASQPMSTTVSVKGNKMRREMSDDRVEIWDLDGRRVIHIDSKKKTYSIVTFDQMRQQMEEARQKAAAHNKGKTEDPQMKMTPKVKITQGAGTKKLLGHTAKEVKVRIDMEMESTDPKAKGQSANMWTTSDQWLAPVTGYDEIKHFYMRMAKEMEWMPGEMSGVSMQMAPAMEELRKNTVKMEGMPLLTNTSVGMTGNGPGAAQPQAESGNPLTKGLGGMFGRKKKKDDSQPTGDTTTASGSLMDMTVEVTSTSANKLDTGLFDVPADYKQTESKEKGRR